MGAPRIDQINVVVSDVVGAARFLQRLGIDVPDVKAPWDAHHVDLPAVATSVHGGHDLAEPRFGIDLDSNTFAQQWGGLDPSFTGLVLNIRVDGRGDVDELHSRAIGLGGVSRRAPYDAFWGSRFALVEGPGPLFLGLMSVPSPAHRGAPPDPSTFT